MECQWTSIGGKRHHMAHSNRFQSMKGGPTPLRRGFLHETGPSSEKEEEEEEEEEEGKEAGTRPWRLRKRHKERRK